MKLLNTARAEDFHAAGVTEARTFGFEMNAIAFHAVIDGIYSDKILAPVREYATNAYDAHIAAGKADQPFLLMAPSTLSPYFMVRDFGPGMTHEEVTQRATTLFGSDKRDSNTQVGMLGLGMKSAFAYTKQYTITCFDGTTKREYVCFLDGSGMPTVSLAAEDESQERTGVMIKFPVQQLDIERFRTAIEKVMIGFDPMPTVLNDQWTPSGVTTLMEGSNYRIVKSNHVSSPRIRQGCVLYPLDITQLVHVDDDNELRIPIIIDVPIGTASVSTSREQLGYDEPTKDNLRLIWQQVRQDIRNELQATLDAPDTFLDACIVYGELATRLGKTMLKQPKWRGKAELRTSFSYLGAGRAAVLLNWDDLRFSPPRQPTGRSRYYQTAPSLTPQELKGYTVVWEAPDCRFSKDRMRMFRDQNEEADILWVKADTLAKVTEYYGVEAVVDLRTIERLKLVRTSRPRVGLSKQDIRTFDRYRSIIQEPEKAVYVYSEGANYEVFGQILDMEQVQDRYIRRLRNIDAIKHDQSVIVLMKNQRNLPKDRPGWIHLDQLLKDTVAGFNAKAHAVKSDVTSFRNDRLVNILGRKLDQLPKRLRDLLQKAINMSSNTYEDLLLSQLWVEVTGKSLPSVTTDFHARFAKLVAGYPLLNVLANNDEHLTHYLKLIAR
ncbi:MULTISPECIES: hypothetical protein [unclassified Mesorhizobium]|uniref:hypothetical protein n=1 Tax=unclassified Mesorhizobium TaxID=325217 RepID=UPI0011296E77|nr:MULTISPECIES: hypothetical protein [unclassified Mesorhizobium]TPJ51784.1 hypothetical protein FJ426_18945 [Mesorhizobium sp. B2-6-4]TPN42406.1 hypothetical protein FJ979_02360 [Mesorhizobium sp. B1-1-6]